MSGIRTLCFALAAVAALVIAHPASASERCRDVRGVKALSLHLAPEVARQGATLKIAAVGLTEDNPWGAPVPVACLKGWTVSDPAVATLAADHGELVIADTAPVGTRVKLTAALRGVKAEIEVTVVARDAVVLTGYWSEVGDAACPLHEPPLRELHFLGDGRFEVTWTPFERYVDYWGTFSFDPATGAVALTPTGGNHVPADADLDGEASLGADGLLRFTDISFGSPSSGAPRRPCGVFKSR
ncbi:MAG: hypothetical protein ACOY4K_04245 [Pseudomonadota bacterium]